MKINTRINTRKIKRIAELTATSVVFVLLVILLHPIYTFTAKIFYIGMSITVLIKLWNLGLSDWDVLAVA